MLGQYINPPKLKFCNYFFLCFKKKLKIRRVCVRRKYQITKILNQFFETLIFYSKKRYPMFLFLKNEKRKMKNKRRNGYQIAIRVEDKSSKLRKTIASFHGISLWTILNECFRTKRAHHSYSNNSIFSNKIRVMTPNLAFFARNLSF